jgi:hypothetical protein
MDLKIKTFQKWLLFTFSVSFLSLSISYLDTIIFACFNCDHMVTVVYKKSLSGNCNTLAFLFLVVCCFFILLTAFLSLSLSFQVLYITCGFHAVGEMTTP